MKNIIIMRVTNVADGLARNGVEIQLRLRRDFAADDDEIRFCVSFAGDAAELVLREAGVQHIIRNGVAHFVRVAFADGLG